MAGERRGGSSKHLIDFEGSRKHLESYDVIADENAILAQESSSSSASESSARSSDAEKDNPPNPLIEPKQPDVESSQVPLFPAEVSSHNPVNSSQLLPPPSPLSYVMAGYDPNRIPSSIFAKPSNPTEWSVASNESLFSIYMGNGSFSKDNAFMLYKSGELPKFDETSNAPPSLSPVIEVQRNDRKNEDISIKIKVKEEESSDSEDREPESTAESNTKKQVPDATDKISSQEKMPPVEDIQVSFSSSNRSFQFPLLDATSGSKTSFHQVMEKHPSEKHPSEKHLKQEPQPAETTPGTTPKAAGNSWFSCFSCCSLGC
ncbi:unnamed protein product [Dovyalis caffra]|uniref:Uncharacterized protein n=1 Tax=Dovyalis caffra TaxID=77055 RepID=A0AAV1ST24_9ROSI|nr:unnamed protein product [Dovyalis caffra]